MSETPIIAPNRIKRSLQESQSVIGTMIVEIRQPSVVQLLANAGFDFVIIDNEHGPFNIETIADLCRMARHLGITPFVRVPSLTYPYIAQSLDSGAQGIMIPRITHAQQVRDVVQMMKYPPVGIRGNALSRGYTDFRSGSVIEAMAKANEESMLIVQIETEQAVENIKQIVAVPGADVALVGPNDLAISLGIPGQMDAPQLHTAIESVIEACQQYNVVPAIQLHDFQLAVYWVKKGMRLISASAETKLMMTAGLEMTTRIRAAF